MMQKGCGNSNFFLFPAQHFAVLGSCGSVSKNYSMAQALFFGFPGFNFQFMSLLLIFRHRLHWFFFRRLTLIKIASLFLPYIVQNHDQVT